MSRSRTGFQGPSAVKHRIDRICLRRGAGPVSTRARPLVRLLGILAGALLTATAAYAQSAAAPSAFLDGDSRAAVIHAAAKTLRDAYVYPSVGERAAQAIEAALADGNYDSLSDPKDFARQLTEDLGAVAHDKHLSVTVSVPEKDRPMPSVPWPARSEGGIVRADLLAGNIGYIEIVSFPPVDLFRHPLDRAMAALAKTRALIIDARRHGGGYINADAYLASYLVKQGAKPVAIDRFVWRNAGTDTFRTESFPSSRTPFSYAGKPLYVLTSNRTFSAGEALAYDLQALHLCTVVGERTAGGAHGPVSQPLGEGFVMAVPAGRSVNPATGTNWERTGVKPDIERPAADALKGALELLGQQPAAGDIDSLSQVKLFTARTTQQPGAEAAVRRLIEGLQNGELSYHLLADGTAHVAREQLPFLHALYTRLGAIQAVSFVELDSIGDEVYDVTLTSGSMRLALTLWPDGKTALAWARLTSPAPL